MNKKIKIIAIAILGLILVSYTGYNYILYGGGRDVQSETAAFTVATKDIVNEFTSDSDASNKKYLEKPVAVSGFVTSVNDKEVILDQSVNCNFLNSDISIKVGQTLAIKGRVVGYDDLLGELKLDQCSINK